MKYRIEVSEEQLRVIGLAVDEYMRLRMGDLLYTGTPAGVGPVRPGDNLRAVLEGRELLNFDIR